MGEEHGNILKELEKQNLPSLNYRTSATYGGVRIAKTTTSSTNDIFGVTVNRCAKINRSSPANGVIIGEGLYGLVKEFEGYFFKKVENESISAEYGYTGYVVSKKIIMINF